MAAVQKSCCQENRKWVQGFTGMCKRNTVYMAKTVQYSSNEVNVCIWMFVSWSRRVFTELTVYLRLLPCWNMKLLMIRCFPYGLHHGSKSSCIHNSRIFCEIINTMAEKCNPQTIAEPPTFYRWLHTLAVVLPLSILTINHSIISVASDFQCSCWVIWDTLAIPQE